MATELRQVFRLRDDKVGSLCLTIHQYPIGIKARDILIHAVASRHVIHPGVYVVTRCEETSSGRPYASEIDVFTLWSDSTLHEGCCPEQPSVSLASWPPRKRNG